MIKLTVIAAILSLVSFFASAQLYTGMSGLIHVPSAEMFEAGEAQIGAYYMNRHFLPGSDNPELKGFKYDGKGYDTVDFYASITPFSWIQIGYAFTLEKHLIEGYDKPGYNMKDRYISLKVQPLGEGKWYPAVALGANDFLSSATKRHTGASETGGYFCNFYIALTKHFDLRGSELGVNLDYRYSPNEYFRKWNGVVGGVAWRPRGFRKLRVMAEWTGHEVNIGADILLWRHLFIQTAMVGCRYFTGGISYRVNLF